MTYCCLFIRWAPPAHVGIHTVLLVYFCKIHLHPILTGFTYRLKVPRESYIEKKKLIVKWSNVCTRLYMASLLRAFCCYVRLSFHGEQFTSVRFPRLNSILRCIPRRGRNLIACSKAMTPGAAVRSYCLALLQLIPYGLHDR